jgi:hypothetical protein
VACALTVGVAAQRGGRAGGAEFAGPPQGPDDVPVVEVVGCLAEGPNSTWTVTNATEPARSAPGFSRADDLKAAEAKPLGSLSFKLIGLVEMSPAEHKGHKVLVKGLLIKDANNSRLNVTSLATASASCPK